MLFIIKGIDLPKNSLKAYQELNLKIKKPQTIQGPVSRFHKVENSIDSVVSEILSYRQKALTTLYNMISAMMIPLQERNQTLNFFRGTKP